MANAKEIKTIFVGIILIAVMGWVTNVMIGFQPTEDTWQTTQPEFPGVADWTLENSSPLAIAHNSSDEWIDITATGSGTGNATVSQVLDIGAFREIKSATVEAAYHIDNADNLTEENMYLRVIDPQGNTDHETTLLSAKSSTVAWASESKDVSDVIDQSGEWTVKVYTEAKVTGTAFESNVDNVKLTVTGDIDQLTVISKLGQYGPYIVMVLIMTLFVSGIVVLLRYLNVL